MEIDKLFDELVKKKTEEKVSQLPVEQKVEEKLSSPTPTPEITPPPVLEEEITQPAPTPPIPSITTFKEPEQYDLSEDKGQAKTVLTIYGDKGKGKTTLALSLPGTIAVISFDRKTTMIKQYTYKNDPRIRVFDALRYDDESTPEALLFTSNITFNYINKILDSLKQDPPDWIVFDGSEILQRICEMVMRYKNNLMPFQGIANLNLWKERRMYIRQLHNKAYSIAKKGVVYTTYTQEKMLVKEGTMTTLEDVPKWIDCIMYETDVVLKVDATYDKVKGPSFWAVVESSKVPQFKTGMAKEITGGGIERLLVEKL